ncbi:MAG: transposase [Elusimicrobia bacterium]|nr:transposase [Elusimicrobiota bacterium]
MSRGNGGEPIIAFAEDWLELRETVAKVKETADFKLYAYCLMANHLHLLLQVGSVSLSRVMQRIQTSWSMRFNLERQRRGHVFQGRFKSLICEDDAYFRWLLRYIHLNPVRTRLVARPEDWRWSSYREYIEPVAGSLADTAWPLSLFGSERLPAVDSFKSFIMQGMEEDPELPPFSDSHVSRAPVERPISGEGRRPELAALAAETAHARGVNLDAILGPSRIRNVCAARRVFVARAVSSGYGIVELSESLGLSTTAVSRMLHEPGVS